MPRQYRLAAALGACVVLLPACSGLPMTGHAKVGGSAQAYRLEGAGSPAVVFQSGLGDGGDAWRKVFPQLVRQRAGIAYDRLGYGDSGQAAGRRDPCAIAREQHELLRSVGLQPPYILVGHSLGGLYQYAYAKLYPDEVAGLVLLEPTHPEHLQRMKSEAPAMAALVRFAYLRFSGTMQREFDSQTVCLDALKDKPMPAVPVKLLLRGRFLPPESGSFASLMKSLSADWESLLGGTRAMPVAGAGHYLQRVTVCLPAVTV